MNNLAKILNVAIELKPKFGEPCNNCGYCCLTEVCAVGKELTDSNIWGPCKLLISNGNKHYCKLAENEEMEKILGIGAGCCAKTQAEFIDIYLKS